MKQQPQGRIVFPVSLQPKQAQIWKLWDESKFTKIGGGGARGGAKSGIVRRGQVLRRLKYAKTTGLILRRTYGELYKSHIVKLFEEFPESQQWYVGLNKEIKFPNGSRLFFGSAEHPGDLSSYHSAEFADITVDEAQEFSQGEMEQLSGSNRCTSNNDIIPKMIYTFMPGISESGIPPKGLTYLKRVFVDRDFRGVEDPNEFAFVQAFSWDNVEWARKELTNDGFTDKEFYSWTEDARRDYYLTRTDYGKKLLGITNTALRDAWLYGKWDVFQGQYFPNFSYDKHTVSPEQIVIKPWHKKWISCDWGYDHPCCVHWFAEDEHGDVVTYRELWGREIGESDLGKKIGELSAGEKISQFYMSWDAFGKLNKETKKSITEMVGAALPKDIAKPTPADASPGSRISGWRLMNQLMDSEKWKISRDCPKLIECLPTLIRDMKTNSEDVLKVDWSENGIGDDAADCVRYGLQNMLSLARKPAKVVMQERLAPITDMTEKHRMHMHIMNERKKSTALVLPRFRR